MQPTSAGVTYSPYNALVEANNRESETMDTISLLVSATASDRDTYSNLSGTVTLLMSELVVTNKNLVYALKENTLLERVPSQCQECNGGTNGEGATGRVGISNNKKGTHYFWSCRYDAGHPSLKCTEKLVVHAKHCSASNTRGGSQNNRSELRVSEKNNLLDNLKEYYEHIHVSSHGCVDTGCMVYCCGDRVLVTNKTPFLKGMYFGQPYATMMWSSHIFLLPLIQFSLEAHLIHILPYMK